ncbi:hypothetical protein [Blastomonas aquatica]|uniref:Uncharacterized protein n=1 Tax=Blastomonas aquatica TaxID=1510276 RepID=A0ABQ1JQK4_9SPHN|nr:hypothetical protein [Blastomonas aquatica]GGB75039.1 hypothetical protein GCM10010833_32820 [Blastomonas aquatica]
MTGIRKVVLSACLFLAMSAPALAERVPTTRLVGCGPESCLLVSGERADAAATVLVNGHAVAAQGARHWRVRVPVSTLRAWSKPHARSISVTVADTEYDASLPVGMLAAPHDLAMLVVRVK